MGNSVERAALLHPPATLKAFFIHKKQQNKKKTGTMRVKSALRLQFQPEPTDGTASTRALGSCPAARSIQSVRSSLPRTLMPSKV